MTTELQRIKTDLAAAQEAYAELWGKNIDGSVTGEAFDAQAAPLRREIEALLHRRSHLHALRPAGLRDEQLAEITSDLEEMLEDDMEMLRTLQKDFPTRSDLPKKVLPRATERRRLLAGLRAEAKRRGGTEEGRVVASGPDQGSADREDRDEETLLDTDPVNEARDLVTRWMLSVPVDQRRDALARLNDAIASSDDLGPAGGA